eukprot:scaffold4373_cov93-Phaeocystis_antarctica.AAC.1
MAIGGDGFTLRALQPAPLRAAPLAMATLGMGAPILTSLAASAMPMTGLDFLTQRAGLTGRPLPVPRRRHARRAHGRLGQLPLDRRRR